MRTLEQMEDNAQRQLDGMTSHRDQMARDVLWLAGTVRRLEAMAKGAAQERASRGFAEAFGNIFGGKL